MLPPNTFLRGGEGVQREIYIYIFLIFQLRLLVEQTKKIKLRSIKLSDIHSQCPPTLLSDDPSGCESQSSRAPQDNNGGQPPQILQSESIEANIRVYRSLHCCLHRRTSTLLAVPGRLRTRFSLLFNVVFFKLRFLSSLLL